jgi:cytochrome c oxidase subunit 2
MIAASSEANHMMRHRKHLAPSAMLRMVIFALWSIVTAAAQPQAPRVSSTNIFAPASTPAHAIFGLSVFGLVLTAVIFTVVFGLLVYSVVKFRGRASDRGREPAQVYGSTQIELAWTVIPVLIVVVLFLATARVIHAIQDAPKPPAALEVTVIGLLLELIKLRVKQAEAPTPVPVG